LILILKKASGLRFSSTSFRTPVFITLLNWRFFFVPVMVEEGLIAF
jgi:hypothetical protein